MRSVKSVGGVSNSQGCVPGFLDGVCGGWEGNWDRVRALAACEIIVGVQRKADEVGVQAALESHNHWRT